MTQTIIKNRPAAKPNSKTLQTILKKLRLIRKELSLALPQENLDECAHPERIKRSFKRALKQFPVDSAWK